MANPMQQPQANDQSDAPVQPIVSGSPNETNARTGGMVSLPAWPTPQAPPTAGQYAQRLGATLGIGAPAAPSPQLAPHSRAAIGPTPADHAKVALGYVLSGETPQVQPGTPAAAAVAPLHEQAGVPPEQHGALVNALQNPHTVQPGTIAQLVTGKPWWYVKELMSQLSPPSLEDQIKKTYFQQLGLYCL